MQLTMFQVLFEKHLTLKMNLSRLKSGCVRLFQWILLGLYILSGSGKGAELVLSFLSALRNIF